MSILVFDIAASRFFTDKKTGEQPRVLRIAWWKDGDDRPKCALVKPSPGMTIAPETVRYHGLSLTRMEADGVDAAEVIRALERDAAGASAIVAFNADFHWRQLYRLMQVEAKPPETTVCAMTMAAPILAIPLMRPGGGFKSPSLREACDFFGVPQPVPAESDPIEHACSTVRAVRAVYEACRERTQ